MKELKSNEVDQGLKGRARRGENGGFPLVEFMVGSGVMTLVLAGCFSGIGQAIVISENVESSNFATQILQSEIDEIHTMQWSEIEQLSNQGTFNPEAYFSTIPLRDYSCQRLINSVGSNQKEIRLIVEWVDLRGRSHNREYVTYYTKDGLFDYSYRSI